MVTALYPEQEPAAEEFTGRLLPQDLAAEQSVIGGMLMSRAAIADVVEHVTGGDFYKPAHELIFDAVLALDARGEPTDARMVADWLAKAGTLARAGGAVYLHTCLEVVPTAANAGYYARIVKERAILRRLVEAGTRVTEFGYSVGGGDVYGLLDAAQAELDRVSAAGGQSDGLAKAGESLTDTIDEIEDLAEHPERLRGVPTGFADLDRLTAGLHPGEMVIVAGRPAMGKSTLALDVARSVAIHHGRPVAYFSLEMSRKEINMRLLAAEAQVPLQRIRKGQMDDADWQRIARVTERINDAPLFIDDSPDLNMTQIRAKSRRQRQRSGLDLIVVDYLQLMSSGRRVENRQQEVSEFSRSMKLLAKELGVPLIAVAQLNRGPEQRQDKRPMLADLRESGSLEQDCDVAVLLHREDMYERESPRAGEADLIVAKHRNGPTATITVAFQGHYARFVDMYDERDALRSIGASVRASYQVAGVGER